MHSYSNNSPHNLKMYLTVPDHSRKPKELYPILSTRYEKLPQNLEVVVFRLMLYLDLCLLYGKHCYFRCAK